MKHRKESEFLKICDGCFQKPQSFIGGNKAGVDERTLHYIVVDEEHEDAGVALMSNLELKFNVWPDLARPKIEGKRFLCFECYHAEFNGEEEDHGE